MYGEELIYLLLVQWPSSGKPHRSAVCNIKKTLGRGGTYSDSAMYPQLIDVLNSICLSGYPKSISGWSPYCNDQVLNIQEDRS